MRTTLYLMSAAVLAVALSSMPAAAKANSANTKMTDCAATWKAMPADKKKATTYAAFSKTCLSAKPAPVAAATPQEKMKACAATWQAMPAPKKKATTYAAYSKTCLKG